MPRPKRNPLSEDQLRQIETMAGLGLRALDIAHVMGVSRKTLYQWLKEDGKGDIIKAARKKGVAKVAETLFKMATSGRVPAATFFYLKTRGGWRETHKLEHTGKDGGPIQHADASLAEAIKKARERVKSRKE